MASITFRLENALSGDQYAITAPIGDRIDTATGTTTRYIDLQGARYKNEGTEEDPSWVIDQTLDYAFKRSYGEFFSYTESDLNRNYIELNDPDELRDPSSSSINNEYVHVKVVGTGGRLNLALWTETQYTPEPVTILHTSFSGAANTGWFNPIYGYPPGVAIGTTTQFMNMNSVWQQTLYTPDGKKPKISFHIETAKHGDYLYPILVVTGWSGYLDTSGEEPEVKYGIIWQRAVSTSFMFGSEIIVPGRTPSTTPNTTPSGGMGARNNRSADVPMPGASGLSGLNYFVTSETGAGIRLYKVTPVNWSKLTQILWSTGWWKKIQQAITSAVYGSFNAPSSYVISAVKIALPVTIDGEPLTESDIWLGPVQYTSQDANLNPAGKILGTRYAETGTYTFSIKPYSDTFLDFDGFTKIEVHVPFCGVVHISPDACMRGQIQVKYIVDLVTGSCCAVVRTIDQFGNAKIFSVLSGQCGIAVPFVSNELTLDKVMGAVGAVATGAASGNLLPVISGAGSLVENVVPYSGSKVTGSATIGGAAAVLGDRSLYVAIYHPQDLTGLSDDDPNYQQDYYGYEVGYPAAYFGTLAELKAAAAADGKAEVYVEAEIDPDLIPDATAAEKEKIRAALKGGLYV